MKVMDLIQYLRSGMEAVYFANRFPPTGPDDCVVVTIFGGGPPDRNIRRPSFQVMVRSKHPAQAEQKALEFLDMLHQKRGFQIGSEQVILCNAQNSAPLYAGTDENGRSFYSVNFSILLEVE
ncbi:minor capsid protein [Heliobacterium mobile]|nr:minor capsid protein [Heliobacterium mobile]